MCRKHLIRVTCGVGQGLLEAVDLLVAPVDLGGGCEAPDAGDQDVLIVRAVEDAQFAGERERLLHAPQEGVCAFLGRGCLERRDPAAGRVEQADDVLDRAALAAGVHALEDEQDAAPVARGARRPQPLLEGGEALTDPSRGGRARPLAVRAAGGGGGVVTGQVERLAAGDAQPLPQRGAVLLLVLPRHRAPLRSCVPIVRRGAGFRTRRPGRERGRGYRRQGPVTANVVPGV